MAVDLCIRAVSISQFLSFLAASQGIDVLHADTVAEMVVSVFAAEAISGHLIVVVAEGGNGNAEDTVLGRNLACGADELLAFAVVHEVALGAGEAGAVVGVEVGAVVRGFDAFLADQVLVGETGGDGNDHTDFSIGGELVVVDAGDAVAGDGVEGVAEGADVDADVVDVDLSGAALDDHCGVFDALAVDYLLGGFPAGEAVPGKAVEGIALILDGVAVSEVVVLSAGTGGVEVADSVDQHVFVGATGADLGLDVVGEAGVAWVVDHWAFCSGAGLEVLVDVWVGGGEGAGVLVRRVSHANEVDVSLQIVSTDHVVSLI